MWLLLIPSAVMMVIMIIDLIRVIVRSRDELG